MSGFEANPDRIQQKLARLVTGEIVDSKQIYVSVQGSGPPSMLTGPLDADLSSDGAETITSNIRSLNLQ